MEMTSERPDINFNASAYLGVTLSELKDFLIKNYIYKLHIGELIVDNLKITKILGINSISTPIPGKLNINYDTNSKYYRIAEPILFISVIYEDEFYEISTRKEYEYLREEHYKYKLHISGISENSLNTMELYNFIESESIKISSFKNSVTSFKLLDSDKEEKQLLECLNIVNPKKTNLKNLFIPENKKHQLQRFIYAINNYRKDKINLRYLLNGIPGTGKTDIINSIINEVKGKATVLFTQGGSMPIKEIFEFCSLFEPCVLVIDDIDFMIGEREKNYDNRRLGSFLQMLDGFLPSNIFLLASTNDKALVDIAASRPGRFDLILDVTEIESRNYLDLIVRETSKEEILNLFDESIIESLRSKRVTGAFIVSLIKQLNSHLLMNGSIDIKDLNNYMSITHKGFYSSNSESIGKVVGF